METVRTEMECASTAQDPKRRRMWMQSLKTNELVVAERSGVKFVESKQKSKGASMELGSNQTVMERS